MLRRRLTAALMLSAVLAAPAACAADARRAPATPDWPLWQRVAEGFIQDDGRVVDWTDNGRTVSEGQGYALFLALIANDRARFARILSWTEANLAGGDLSRQLPAWLWGRDAERDLWTVLDPNPATDADLFIAQALIEAGRLWSEPRYAALGRAVLDQVKQNSIRNVDGRALLLPAPQGFESEQGTRLNPSYVPPFQFHFLAGIDPAGPWAAILEESVRALDEIAPRGLVPDWILLAPGERGIDYRPDIEFGTQGSYDAIRVYLWTAMDVPGLDAVERSRATLAPVAAHLRAIGQVPERWDVATGRHEGAGPAGFQLAMAPLLDALGDGAMAIQLRAHADQQRTGGLYGRPARYYDQMLALFAEGWREDRFRFDNHGRLIPKWHSDSAHSR